MTQVIAQTPANFYNQGYELIAQRYSEQLETIKSGNQKFQDLTTLLQTSYATPAIPNSTTFQPAEGDEWLKQAHAAKELVTALLKEISEYADKFLTTDMGQAAAFLGDLQIINPELKETCVNLFSKTLENKADLVTKAEELKPIAQELEAGVSGAEVRWNFWKALVKAQDTYEALTGAYAGQTKKIDGQINLAKDLRNEVDAEYKKNQAAAPFPPVESIQSTQDGFGNRKAAVLATLTEENSIQALTAAHQEALKQIEELKKSPSFEGATATHKQQMLSAAKAASGMWQKNLSNLEASLKKEEELLKTWGDKVESSIVWIGSQITKARALTYVEQGKLKAGYAI